MLQPAEALLIGFLGAMLLVATGLLVWMLFRVSGRLDAVACTLVDIESALREAMAENSQSRERLKLLQPALRALLQTITAMQQSTEAIRGLSSLLTNRPTDEPPAPMWTRGAPPNPNFDQFASREDAGYLEQSEEDLAEIERQNELRDQGIETDPLRIPQPPPDKINFTDLA